MTSITNFSGELSEKDLEKLGLSLGHRRKLLKALASRTTALVVEEADTSSPEAERRQVTVLFADLVGSTALANEIDPEEMSALIKRYQEICAGAIARFDGFIAKFMGDGVLAYFGYPQAQENATERSVYASDNAVALAEKLDHTHSTAHALLNATLVCVIARDYPTLDLHAQRLLEVAEKYNFPPNRAHALIMLGLNRALGEGDAQGLATIETEFPRASAIGAFFRIYSGILAEARLRFGKVSEALEVLDWALGTVTEPGVGLYGPELHRLRGLCLLHRDSSRHDEAMGSLQTAFETGRQQGATLFQRRAAMDLAEASHETETEEKFHQSLADFCGTLPQEFDAAERARAAQLLSAR